MTFQKTLLAFSDKMYRSLFAIPKSMVIDFHALGVGKLTFRFCRFCSCQRDLSKNRTPLVNTAFNYGIFSFLFGCLIAATSNVEAQTSFSSNSAAIELATVSDDKEAPRNPIDSTSPSSPMQVGQEEMKRSLQTSSEDRTRDLRVRGIEQRIDILKDLIARQAAAEQARLAAEASDKQKTDSQLQPNQSPSGASPPVVDSNSNLSLPSELSQSGSDTAAGSPSAPNTRGLSGQATELNDPTGHEKQSANRVVDTSATDSNDWTGIPLTSSPINSLELANSLFRSGHYSQAIKSYQDLLDRNPEQVDKSWLKLLAANCFRVLGDQTTAERLYREVTSLKEKSYAHDHARWYLNYLAQRKKVEAQWHAIEREIMSYQPNKQ